MTKEAMHLGYHYISDEQAPGPTCPPSRLCDQITILKDQGFAFLTCGEVVEILDKGGKLPEKHATLSFDDGLKNQFEVAYPILKESGVPATFFHTTSGLD